MAAIGNSTPNVASQNVFTVLLSADSWLKSWLGTPITVSPRGETVLCSFSSPSY